VWFNLEYKYKRFIEISLGLGGIFVFLWLISLEPLIHITFISHFIYICSLINMMIFNFKNKHLTTLMISTMPTNVITLVAFQIADIYYSLTVLGYYILEHMIRNFILHGIPPILAYYIIRIQKGKIFNWEIYKNVIIVFILWCYFMDYRYTDVIYAYPYMWFMFGDLIWNTTFVYFFLKSREKKTLRT